MKEIKLTFNIQPVSDEWSTFFHSLAFSGSNTSSLLSKDTFLSRQAPPPIIHEEIIIGDRNVIVFGSRRREERESDHQSSGTKIRKEKPLKCQEKDGDISLFLSSLWTTGGRVVVDNFF